MGELYIAVHNRKENIIQKLIEMDYFQMVDGRQLYEVPLSELEKEFQSVLHHTPPCPIRAQNHRF